MSVVKGKKGFKCQLCPKTYATERGYKNHLTVHPVASSSADLGAVSLTSTAPDTTISTFDKNTETAGSDVNVLTCGVCDKNFKTNNGLAKHLKKQHAQGLLDSDLASETTSNQVDDNIPSNFPEDWLEDDPIDPNDKPTEIDEVSYFEDLIEEEEEEEARRASHLDEPPQKKQRTGKVQKAKKPPLLKCRSCKRPFQTLDGFMKHRQTHVIEVVYANAPDMARLKAECSKIAFAVLNEMKDRKYSVGPSAQVAKTIEILMEHSSTQLWTEFIHSACEGLFCDFLLEIKKQTPNQLRESFVRKSGIYQVSEIKGGKLLHLLSMILDLEKSIQIMTCSAFLRQLSKKLFAFFLHVMIYEGENPPVCLPSKYEVTNQSVDSLEFKEVIYYIGGSNVKSILRTGLRRKNPSEEWNKIIEVLKKYFIIGDFAEAPDADVMNWTLAQDKGRLIKISDEAFNFFVKLARLVKPLERDDGSLYVEEVISTVASSPELTFAWGNIVRDSLSNVESFKLLHAICSHFCVT